MIQFIDTSHKVRDRYKLPVFRPIPFLKNGWAQTIAGRYWPQWSRLPQGKVHQVILSDGDRLVVIENRPLNWKATDRIIILVHGLAGCDESSYMIRLTSKLIRLGYCVMRINLRGCGPGFGLARQSYHSGRSEDTRAVLNYLRQIYPNTPVTQIGFSLGANITLKMAGEDGDSPSGGLDSVIAVSPPIQLAESAKHLSHERNRFFDQFFVRELRKDVKKFHNYFPDIPFPHLPEKLTLVEFDNLYTAPRNGFRDASDYYEKSSSAPWIPKIQVPTLILSSMDDPVIESKSLLRLPPMPHLDLVLTEYGGHVGFLGWNGRGVRWMDSLILSWVKDLHPE